MVKRNISL